jgi:glycosyltransferase involved in cell wall biosynthesis
LTSLGYRTRIVTSTGAVGDAGILVALHAYKTSRFVANFHRKFPPRPIVVVLTGTDVYSSSLYSRTATNALEAAGAIVTLQPLAIERLPKRLQKKAIAVLQSARRVGVEKKKTPGAPVRLCVIGHLRREKDPLRAAHALRYLKGENVEVLQAGAILDPQYAARLKAVEARDPRYRYLGEVSSARALRLLAGCDALVLSSRSEGGANVASEAIANGVPVLASRIDGNVGVFGADYAGYYPVGSSERLAALVDRFMHDQEFARSLRRQIRALAPSVSYRSERAGLARALALARRNASESKA